MSKRMTTIGIAAALSALLLISSCSRATSDPSAPAEQSSEASASLVRGDHTEMSDSLVLVQFYNETDGANWWWSEGWFNDPLEYWRGGVKTEIINGRKRVVELRLGANNLTGSIPAVLGKLTELRALDLKWNKHLTGSIPEELYDLTKLEVLNLRMTGITGILSPMMGQWIEMDTLNLRTCTYRQEAYPLVRNTDRMTGELPKEIGRLTKMRYLDLGRQGFSGELPEQLGNCVALEDLALEECNFSGELPGSLTRLERLWQIVLTDNDLSGELPRSLGEMKYHLPSREEWLSILPDDPDMVYFDWDKDPPIDREETVKVGSETITSKNDYKTTDLGKSFALRFKGTKYASAWLYEWTDADGLKVLKITAAPVNASKVSITDVMKDAFWEGAEKTVRILPAAGCVDDWGDNAFKSRAAYYLSATSKNDTECFRLYADQSWANVGEGSKTYNALPVCLFLDKVE